MKEYDFDLSECYSPDDIHSLLSDKLPLPEYYGGNLDALHDVLTSPHEPWHLSFSGTKAAAALVGGKYMRNFKRMCEYAAAESSELEISFSE